MFLAYNFKNTLPNILFKLSLAERIDGSIFNMMFNAKSTGALF